MMICTMPKIVGNFWIKRRVSYVYFYWCIDFTESDLTGYVKGRCSVSTLENLCSRSFEYVLPDRPQLL